MSPDVSEVKAGGSVKCGSLVDLITKQKDDLTYFMIRNQIEKHFLVL